MRVTVDVELVHAVEPYLREVGVLHGDHEGAAVLQPLAVVGLAYDVREVEERANVLNPPMGDGGATHEDLLAVDHCGHDVGGEATLVGRPAEADRQGIVDLVRVRSG